MGYWSKGQFIKTGGESRKQLSEIRKIVKQVVANVECGAITATDAMSQLLEDYPALKNEHRDHPLISSGLLQLYTDFWVPKIVLKPIETVQDVTVPALLRVSDELPALEAGQS